MVDSRYNTLLIIEGEQCEKNFFDKFIEIVKADKNIKIVKFCNDVYELYKKIDDLVYTTTKDVILKECQLDDQTRGELENTQFVYTYLIFDLDLQDGQEEEHQAKLQQVAKMLKVFADETGDYGKLFVNYPMMESYRHLNLDNLDTLYNKSVTADNNVLTRYKDRVSKEGTNKNVKHYTSHDFCNITMAHLKQANLLLNGKFAKPTPQEYQEIIDIAKIHNKQSQRIIDENEMLVLNTSTFMYSEYNSNILKSRN